MRRYLIFLLGRASGRPPPGQPRTLFQPLSLSRGYRRPSASHDPGRPHTWYDRARRLKRRVIVHAGPTNSGKTHTALERLGAAKSGVYCGPLRLLAWEVHERLNSKGVPCSLWTGQEIKEVAGAKHISCTVEMTPLNGVYDCAVVDEVQLIGDRERGWAWTRAVLGIPAMELHLCGSPAFVRIIEALCSETGDDLEASALALMLSIQIRTYDRLSPLKAMSRPVKDWADIKPGDCVVAFSRRRLFQLKNEIELASPQRLRCCIVYGGLPPEARKEQARLFNDVHSGFDVLVASDAIGMGLNLNIGRIIFADGLDKFDGTDRRPLTTTEVKQISGRAGRFQSRFEEGRVTARKKEDVTTIKRCLRELESDVPLAGLKPTREQLEVFAAHLGVKVPEEEEEIAEWLQTRTKRAKTKALPPDSRFQSLADLLDAFIDSAKLDEEVYFHCDIGDMKAVAYLIEDIPMLLNDRYTFTIAPVDAAKREIMSWLRWYAKQYSKKGRVKLGMDLSLEKVPRTPSEIARLEEYHAICDCYLWLATHFPDGVFEDAEEASVAAETCSDLIEKGLKKLEPVDREAARSRMGRSRLPSRSRLGRRR